MRPTTLFATFGVLSLASVAAFAPENAVAAEMRIDASGFTRVALEGAMDVIIEQGNTTHIMARGSEKALADLDPVVEKGVLRLKQKRGIHVYGKDDRITVTIRMPKLDSFALAGAGNVTFNQLKASTLDLKIAGSGDIKATGGCHTLNINLAGSGDIDAKDFKCEVVAVKIAGSGDVSAFASKDFSARIAGAGNINVYGNPENRSRSVFGSGKINYVAKK